MKDKVVIITGGSDGIGKALVKKYLQEGSKVVFTGRKQDKIDLLVNEFIEFKDNLLGFAMDASLEENNKKMVEETINKFGKIDILICNAGITMRALLEDLKLDVFRKVMDINFYGALYATYYTLPHIIASKGSIVGISSINGHRGTPARTAYTASKFAMNGFYEALRTEVMKRGVHILVVSPGFTGTNIRKAALTADGSIQGESPRNEKKMMSADTVADKTYQAVINKKRDLVLTNQGKLVVNLNKFLPGLVDNIVYKVLSKEPDSPLK
ncbi:MAG TPA: SDR family oxidoreductase [Cyclobacteriaceae bacterium]